MNIQSKVLFIDDDQTILNLLSYNFKNDYQLFFANSAEEALCLLANKKIDVVVSDMKMPGMNGDSLLERVAQLWPQTMRIVLTGLNDMKVAIAAINKGQIFAFHTKPWDKEVLKFKIDQAARIKRLQEEKDALEEKIKVQNKYLQTLNAKLETKVDERTAEIKQSYDSSVKIFSSLLQRREGLLNNLDIADLANVIAVQHGLEQKVTEDIYYAGLLHSIGLLCLKDQVLHSNIYNMPEQDFEEFKHYPQISALSLTALTPLKPAADIILHHRELYNGTGFPHGLSGDKISVSSSILCIAIEFYMLKAGLLLDRVLTTEEACNYIKENSDIRYPADVVATFIQVMKFQGIRPDTHKVTPLDVAALQPGMIVQEDVFSDSKVLLIPKGHKLSQANIDNLQQIQENTGHVMVCYVKN